METEVRLGKVSIGKDSIELGDSKGEGEPSPNSKNPKRFVKPSLDEVIAYCQERRNSVNPEKFIDYYESNGWKVGKNSMKDWKAAVRTWEKNSFQSNKPKEEYHTPTEADYDFSDWYK